MGSGLQIQVVRLGSQCFYLLSPLTSPSPSFTENRNGGLWKINLPLLIQLTMGNAGIQPLKGTDQNLLSYFFILSTWPGASGSGSNT